MAASASAWDLHLHLHPCLHQLPLFHLLPTASPPPLQAAPMAYLVEQAGGLATTGKTRIMDLVPQNVHQRVPVILGSPDDVKECRRYYDAFTASATMDGSDEATAIRARRSTRLPPCQGYPRALLPAAHPGPARGHDDDQGARLDRARHDGRRHGGQGGADRGQRQVHEEVSGTH